LSAGSFKNTALFRELLKSIKSEDFIDIYTTEPNRYSSFSNSNYEFTKGENFKITRIGVKSHQNGIVNQVRSFYIFYKEVQKEISGKEYNLVYASSSRLFTAFLGCRISKKMKLPLYLDIRDIFADTIKDVFKDRKLLMLPISLIAKKAEKSTFKRATHINLVSKGFKNYFQKYPYPTYSYYSNGIDDEFLEYKYNSEDYDSVQRVIITYAGNIGSGQGLEKIIPQAAKELGNKYLFRIIGDGGTRNLLMDEIKKFSLSNIEVLKPVNRNELLDYYDKSTFLFLHLNDLEAFKKVLPSKIFEYGATNKPIIAGVAGYAAEFIKENLNNYILFNPIDVDSLVKQIKSYPITFKERSDFKAKFERCKIMNDMAISIIHLANTN